MSIEHTPEVVLKDALRHDIEDVIMVIRTRDGDIVTCFSHGTYLEHLGMLQIGTAHLIHQSLSFDDGESFSGPLVQ